MKTVKHWLADGAPPEYVKLLQAARAEQPTRKSIKRAFLAAGVAGAASLASLPASGTAGAVAAKGVVAVVIKWVAVGLLGTGALVATVNSLERQPSPQASAVTLGSSAPRVPLLHPVHKPNPSHTDRELPSADGAVRSGSGGVERRGTNGARLSRAASAVVANGGSAAGLRPQPGQVTSRGATLAESGQDRGSFPRASARRPQPDSALSQEIALIDAARSELKAGNAQAALRSANWYHHEFPSGRFVPEALYLTMRAREQLGELQAASEVAREIVRRSPNGPHVERARELLKFDNELQNP